MEASLKKAQPLYRQVVGRLEAKILAGEWNAGQQLPTTQELARQFGVTVQTVQQGAAMLCRRGLIERIPGRGTFVSNRISARTMGIVFGNNVFGDPHTLFFQRLYGLICRELKRLDWNVSLYFPAEEYGHEQMLAELGQDVDSGKLRGLIPLCTSAPLVQWLREHPSIPHGHLPSWEHLAALPELNDAYVGVNYLLGRGYRRIAVVLHTETSPPEFVAATRAQIQQAYERHEVPLQARIYEGIAASVETGVEQARAALAAPDGPPEAFLVLNDMGCAGVIFELLCRRYRIPDDIAVMAATNKDIAIPSPVTLTRLERDPHQYARMAIDRTLARIEGRESTLQPLVSKLIIGKSCGE